MKTKKHPIYLLLAVCLLLVACGNPSLPESALPEPAAITTTVSVTPPVEYGASLDEWNEAVNDASTSPLVDATLVHAEPTALPTAEPTAVASEDDDLYLEILWDALIPADYTPDAIMEKYGPQLALLDDNSPEASELYAEMQKEFNNAPVNEEISGKLVKLPGFVTPLEYDGDRIVEFLLVPYFGACLHVPAPPVNQTVLVKAAEGEGLLIEESYWPIWIKGTLTAESAVTELAQSGYYMENAEIEPYSQ